MGSAATTSEREGGAGVPANEFRAALDAALAAADADERIGPLIRATRLRIRFEFPDAGIVLNVGAPGGERLAWAFSDDVEWEPRLKLRMSSEVANRFLQGRESLAIAIARGRVSCSGSSRAALAYLPATRLICDAYRDAVTAEHPTLAV